MKHEYTMDGENYKLTEIGEDHEFVIFKGPEIAISYLKTDGESEGSVLMHGSPNHVEVWARDTRIANQDAGKPEIASRIETITGKFPAHELNKLVSTEQSIDEFLAKLSQRALPSQT